MRKVDLFKPVRKNNNYLGKKKIGEGKFHQWGTDFEEFDTGPGNYTVAIIELSDGNIETFTPDMIRFKDEKNNQET